MNQPHKLIISNTAVQLVGKLINTSVDLLVTLLITRFLGASTYGDFTKTFTLVTLLYLFLDFGFNAIIVRRLGHKPKSLTSEFSTLLSTRLVYAFMLFTLLCLFLLLTPTTAATGYTPQVKLAIFIFGLSLFSQAIFTSVNALFQHHLHYLPVVISGNLGTLLGLVAVILSLLFSPGLLTLVSAHLFGSFIMAITSLVFVSRLTRPSLTLNFAASLRLISETLPVGLMLFLNALMIRLDNIIVTLTRPTLEVGWLGLAYRIYDTLLILPLFFLNALYPILIREHKLNPPHFRHLVWRAGQLLFVTAFPLSLILFFSTPLLTLFGPDMLPAAPALKILSFALPIFFITSLLQWTLIALHRERTLILAYAAGLLFNATVNIFAIPRWGYLSAAITTGLTELIVLSLLILPVLKSFSLTNQLTNH